MVSLEELPLDILHQVAKQCTKRDLLNLRLAIPGFSYFLTPYIDRHLVHEMRHRAKYHLHRAVSTNCPNKSLLPRLLNAGAPLDQRKHTGETVLHAAARQNNVDGIRQLLRAGATVDSSDRYIWTPLHLAARYGYVDIVRILVEAGADINRQGFHGWTALHFAVRERHLKCEELLLEYGIDVEICDNDGKKAGQGAKCYAESLPVRV
ncbi:Ankyrin-2 [Aspergillus alliaceus]|uniref:Ankyrin repeat-containing domain protein n=1 Tax=Petromyces alliaceus TaxID=209559 RepID=A0A5N7BRW1_PETAA|nr:ankyrin repeat-containing domain protein [Aspergillus alliaceus]KAB8234081.1 ankyrin repeat-containing domain protein [Aspergillus alliaceus]KAE8384561.1 ankyrin repeat-containing domain protein [Aspergillus alliaceus]KAF5863465.1 Ankyrin-2 [Aspergillus burnettii]